MRLVSFLVFVAFVAVGWAADAPTREQLDFFEAKVRPVLAGRCFECHSVDAKKLKGGLLLDTRDGVRNGGENGPAIEPGDPDKSLLIEAIRHLDKDTAMPPKEKLPEHEIAALVEWVAMGAPDPRGGATLAPVAAAYDWENARRHWSYQPVHEPAPPTVKDNAWPRNDLDRFILAKLEEKGLGPTVDADPRTLIRRLTFDLIGLPPTPEEAEQFVQSCAANPSTLTFHLSTLADRLLARPQYGERWGRHWMDVVRYADTAGDNSDYPIPQAWRYRNYIIDAFNADKPFDQFIREQIAGDLLPARDQAQRDEQTIATGYIAMSRRFGSVVDRYPYHLTIEDTLENLGRTFLGLGLSCARCHDHKFDPIPQRDYYGLYGIFESTRYAFPGIELLKAQKDFVPLVPLEESEKTLAPFREKTGELQARYEELVAQRKRLEARKKALDASVESFAGAERTKASAEVAVLEQDTVALRGRIESAAKAIEAHQRARPALPDAYAVQDGIVKDARLQLKGEPERLGQPVPRKFLTVLGGETLSGDAAKTSGRLQLAEWIASARNPLTARVIVNRVWQHHFGSGLVGTPNDFGVRGLPPTHPELLDWLTARFIADGWSLKRLHKRILLSRTWQLSSISADTLPAADALDPDNHWHARFSRRRLDAEALRDTLLAISGKLDPTPLTEPHPFPPEAKWDYTQHKPFRETYPSRRRSVYLMTARLNVSPYFQAFDGPDRNASTPVRDSSVTTGQALFFMNDGFLHEQAAHFAERLIREAPDDNARSDRAFALALQRLPTYEERTRLRSHLSSARAKLAQSENREDRERAALASFARALFRTSEFLYLD